MAEEVAEYSYNLKILFAEQIVYDAIAKTVLAPRWLFSNER
jgi:hypothetical protein